MIYWQQDSGEGDVEGLKQAEWNQAFTGNQCDVLENEKCIVKDVSNDIVVKDLCRYGFMSQGTTKIPQEIIGS